MTDELTGGEPEEDPVSEFRRLPPRITPEEMVPTQPLVRVDSEADVGTDTEWQMRAGGLG
jgi:hypothetical protein